MLFIPISIAFLVAIITTPIVRKMLLSSGIIHLPTRIKRHNAGIPSMGGIALYTSFIIAVLLSLSFSEIATQRNLIGALTLIFLVGLAHDTKVAHRLISFSTQIAAALIIVVVCDIRLTSLYGLFGWGEFPLALSYILSVFTIIVITNAFNLIDGIDGLSGVVGTLASLFFGIWFYLNGDMGMSFIALAFAGGLVAFLHFNWAPSKIFMGDTGSLLIGFYLSVAAIQFINLNYALDNSLANAEFAFSASIGTVIAVLIIPLADTLRVFIKRALKGKSPMHPDRTHVHHILLRLGCNHAQATSILGTVNLIFVLLALVFQNLGDAIVIPAVILTALALSTILDFIFRSAIERRKEELRAARQKEKRETRVVRLPKVGG